MHEPLKSKVEKFFLVPIRRSQFAVYAGIDRLRGEYTMAVFIRQGSRSFYADAMYRIPSGFVNSESECLLCCESTLDRENHLPYAV